MVVQSDEQNCRWEAGEGAWLSTLVTPAGWSGLLHRRWDSGRASVVSVLETGEKEGGKKVSGLKEFPKEVPSDMF